MFFLIPPYLAVDTTAAHHGPATRCLPRGGRPRNLVAMARTYAWIVPGAAVTVALASAVTAASVSISSEDGAAAKSTPQMVTEFNAWVNGFLFSESVFEWANEAMGPKAAHYFLTYARNFLAGSILYYVTASIWHW